ncbi:uncharacterized protein E0L32_004395 [Thyridium curvatum]|uniref:Rhamnogalacturonase A/B/Epimerase-like pectate lyase domain-containing protein n=1 Tax=Thyridium curvatum TaxID=1093900 RepID=A0A507AXA4_9PEZI|nr:uncharacterized protein E0L32_004395 [Thyridium curvatum]TPX15415.1 hypothetical protein E0L32_004395 [Thyridium curvatum]
MRSHSFQSLITLSSLLSATALGHVVGRNATAPVDSGKPVTVWVHSTVTTCPTPPPVLCSSTGSSGGSGSGTSTVNYNTTSKVTVSSTSTVRVCSTCSSAQTTTSGGSSIVYPTTTGPYTNSTVSSSSTRSSNGTTTSVPTTTSAPTSSASSSSSSSTSISSTSTSIAAPACTDYWLSKIKHQGYAPYADSPSTYQVFRNVKDYGAKGDGSTDDADAINKAIGDQGRCTPGKCNTTSTTPALIYFPPGTYVISKPILNAYLTSVVGNPECMPVIKGSSSFRGAWLFDGNQYGIGPNGGPAWLATNVFWRQVRNFVFDLTELGDPSQAIAGIHWTTSQATSLQNIVFKLSTAPGNKQIGVAINEGSGGYLGDLVFNGGAQGMAVGNQQFTMRNLTFNGCATAIKQAWDWGWTYKGVSINNCQVGLDMSNVDAKTGRLPVGSVVFIDSEINNTPVGILVGNTDTTQPAAANSLVLENVRLNNVATAIQGPNKKTLLGGSSGQSTIAGWAQGHAYTPTGPNKIQGPISPNARPGSLTSGTDFYERSKPQYEKLPVSQFVSVRDAGAKGDGSTDDTAAINKAIAQATAAGKVVFFDWGMYVVTSTVEVPAGARIVGEAYPIIVSSGAFFSSMDNPKPVVQIGKAGDVGSIEWSEMIVSTRGAQAGAVLIEYNLASPASQPSGIWDVHTRIGGFKGSDLQLDKCPKTPNTQITSANLATDCIAAYMSMHVTKQSSGLYVENVWLWVADHDVEDNQTRQITIYAGRGLLVESQVGNVWLVGTGVEHHVLYEYQFVNTKDVFIAQAQTETAYYQPNPDARIPFPPVAALSDPVFAAGESGWGVRVVDSSNVLVYGAGLYSFFSNNDLSCSQEGNGETCQKRTLSIEGRSSVSVYNLNTVGTTKMITVDGTDVASYQDNLNGFVDTVALFRN